MIETTLEELVSLYVVGAISDEEHRAFDERLQSGWPEAEVLLADHGVVVESLAEPIEPVEPSPIIRERLLQRIAKPLFIQSNDEGVWKDFPLPGIRYRMLYADEKRYTALVRMSAGSRYPAHTHSDVEECLVLEGEVWVGSQLLRAGDYQRGHPGTFHDEQRTENGCLMLLNAALSDLTG